MKTYSEMKVLVVDDNKPQREMIKNMLETAGFKNVGTAVSAEEAIQLLYLSDSKDTSSQIDLVLMDIIMPDVDGLQALERIKSEDRFKDLPVIMVTARTDEKDLDVAFKKGAIDYITKPVSNTELLARVRSALRLKREIGNRKTHEQKLLRITEDLRKAFEHIQRQNGKLEGEISERKRIEETLRSFEKAIENMQIGVTISDTSGKIVYVNPAEAAMHGYKPDELKGADARIFAPEHLWRDFLRENLKDMKSLKRESENVRRDGSLFPVQLLSDVVLNSDGTPIAVVTTCEDITERKKTEENLKRTQGELEKLVKERTKELMAANALLKEEIVEKLALQAETVRSARLASLGELSAGVAHEINNPINGIINCARILVNRAGVDKKEMEIAEMIIGEGKRIANIVQALLSFARERKEKKGTVKLYDVLKDSLALTSAHMRKDGIALNIDFPDDLPPIFGHHQQIEQVFLNLINNAQYALNKKFPGPNKDKTLEISAAVIKNSRKPVVRISFIDRGTGIPSDILDKAKEPFFTTKPANEGTGLGLSISHGIISDHGGQLTIESKEGEYTRVIIDLQAAEKSVNLGL